ncbi:MAG: hypothetical protein LBS45_09895 [Synergistaceae bacterium]|jgi:hypothetical protein|nr:hypothetical protein [Synergistaceae bacterium]
MPNLAPWEIEENERWMYPGGEPPEDFTGSARFTSGQVSDRTARNPSRFERGGEDVPERNIGINPHTAEELKRIGAFEGYTKYHRQVLVACAHMREHLKKLGAALFKDCELESLPERYEEISRELEENWRLRKQSPEAVRRGIFLATELIKAFPVYRFFIPLKSPLRLVGCMADRLDASQVSLVLDKINRLPSAPYSEPSFLGMRCVACDRLMSFYLRAGEYDKALDACDCGITLESADPRSKNRFQRRKKAIIEMVHKKGSAKDKTKNTWGFSYERQFKRSLHDFSNATLR